MKTKKMTVVLALLALSALAVAAAAYLSLLDYPPIVRSAYYRNPVYVFQAVSAEYFANKPVAKSAAVQRVREIGLTPTGSPRFLYLLGQPAAAVDKPIIDRYFGLLSKVKVNTNETAFWEIPVHAGLAFVEVHTGRVIQVEADAYGNTRLKYYPAEG